MPEYASSADIQRLIDAWSEKARAWMGRDTLSADRVADAYFECADALRNLGPLPYVGDPDGGEEHRSYLAAELARGVMTPNQARKLLGYA